MNQNAKNDYRDKLRRFLSTPHSSKAYYDEYQKEHEDDTFDDYTKRLEGLIDKLDEGKLEEQSEFCQEIKALKLPHNQFGCDS
jgi:hypothetical protein